MNKRQTNGACHNNDWDEFLIVSLLSVVKSHLNCAQVLHEYSIRYKNLCRELEPVTVLEKVG